MRALDRADLAPPHVPMRQRREIAAIPQCEQQTARRIDDSSDRADDALVQFPIAAACDSHRPDETQPFAAIVIFIGEEVLGDFHPRPGARAIGKDRKSTRLNSRSLMRISYAVFC